MLEKLSTKKKITKQVYAEKMEVLGEELGVVQRKARAANRPIIIVFEGWRGAHRSDIINTLMQQMDARGFDVLSSIRAGIDKPSQPFFTYFWKHLPALGHISVYHRSWYYLKNAMEVMHNPGGVEDKTTLDHINSFEKALTDDNYIILKYFLHLSEDQQKKNLEDNVKTLGKAWREVNPAYDEEGAYDVFEKRYDHMLEKTDTHNAPWHIIAADDTRSAKIDVFESIVESINAALDNPPKAAEVVRSETKYDVLSKIDPNSDLTKEEYKKKLDKYQKKLSQLQIEMFREGIATVVAFEGWDAAGKGGAIRRLTASMDPLGYVVHPIAAPNVVERNFHYLWRFWTRLPNPGSVAIFDRTWYGRVMVERLEGFAKPHEWQRAYDEIKEMEQQWAEHGIAIAKFWLQIDKDEQLRRFTDRQNNPLKEWKITDEDWRNRDKWDAYEEAVNEMLVRTDTSYAPWTVVEGNNKYYARLKVLKTMIDLFEEKLGKK